MKSIIFLVASTAIFAQDVTTRVIERPTAYISSQCYTKTKDDKGVVHNPCYSCHTQGREPNFIDDSDVQTEYVFPKEGLKNPFTNLFVDRSAQVKSISDKEIAEYIKGDNYKSTDGTIFLAEKLKNLPKEWDYDKDGKWDGYIPDCNFHFDAEGFDRDNNSGYSGWRAFGYYPFLGTFWPTNGSTDDVLIRLDKPFMQDSSGNFDKETYMINLAIVESLIMKQDIKIEAVDEKKYGVDLDKDGKLGTANIIKYEWAPLDGLYMSYVGRAKELLEKQEFHLAAGLYPERTEFLHSVRYVDVDKKGGVSLSPRMKELRYMRKNQWITYSDIRRNNLATIKEKYDFPERHEQIRGDMERGMSNGYGWRLQGFLEDKNGDLRPQSDEETLFCIGCHSNLGATADSTFSFGRKSGHFSGKDGWYHWSQKGLKGVPEPKRADGKYEYSYYLENNHAGDEFRENSEVMAKFFDKEGNLKQSELKKLHGDISHLLFPSSERALNLNKAYRVIVMEQSFTKGRDATITPAKNVHKEVEQDQPTGIEKPIK